MASTPSDHAIERRARDVEHAGHVRRDHLVPVAEVRLLSARDSMRAPSSVHENVHVRERRRKLREDLPDLARVAYVEGASVARVAELARERVETFLPPSGHDDARAVLHEDPRARFPDSGRSAGHECNAPLHARNRSVALTSSWRFPASIAECPASGTMRRSASGQARWRAQAVSIGQTTS